MRIAYLDCFAGIAGDMFLGALIHAGVPPEVLHEATAALNLNASLKIETVDRSGISSIKVHVLVGDHLAESATQSHSHDHPHVHEQQSLVPGHTRQLETQHRHKTGHAHTHDHEQTHEHTHEHTDADHQHTHEHTHGRSLTQIRTLIAATQLHSEVKALAIKTFDLLGHSEARIHNVPVDDIHFHEVGAVDAIVDIVAACAGIHHLQIGAWYSSPVNVGGGMVQCAHGNFPVPAPATADLLRGFPTYSAHIQKELVTPTGAAILRALSPTFGPQPAMSVGSIGYGAGTRNPVDFPNVLRIAIGQSSESAIPTQSLPTANPLLANATTNAQTQTVAVLETALDDLSPQLIAHVTERALAIGALDVMLTPVIMKKGRPGTLLTILCDPADTAPFEQLILTETSTLGLRIRHDRRICLDRTHTTVTTAFGPIRIKLGTQASELRNAAPEFEDCRAAAAHHSVPLKQVQQAAIAAYEAVRPR